MPRTALPVLTSLLLVACASAPQGSAPAPVREAATPGTTRPAAGANAPPPAAAPRPQQAKPSSPPARPRNDASASPGEAATSATPPAWGQRFYLDDGPGDMPAAELDRIPDAVPVDEAPHRFANRPYSVFGVTYEPATPPGTFSQRGMASWYGRRFQGKPTSSGEPYDMYKMSAAHPTLPIPSYARVTHLANGRSVVVRINDRGPFHPGRIMDLSYAAAHRLGYANKGSAEVLVEAIRPGELVENATADAAQASKPPRSEATAMPLQPAGTRPEGLWLQLGAFRERANAERLRDSLAGRVGELSGRVEVFEHRGSWRVGFGPVRDEAGVASLRSRLLDLTGLRAITLRP